MHHPTHEPPNCSVPRILSPTVGYPTTHMYLWPRSPSRYIYRTPLPPYGHVFFGVGGIRFMDFASLLCFTSLTSARYSSSPAPLKMATPAKSRGKKSPQMKKLFNLLHGENVVHSASDNDACNPNTAGSRSPGYSSSPGDASPYSVSPMSSPFVGSPWTMAPPQHGPTGLVGSLVREEGRVYSIAAAGGLLYTGSDSKNIRVWKGYEEFSGFKSSSGLVKSIVVSGGKVFTGHQDGKIRIWKLSSSGSSNAHKRVGSLPRLKDLLKTSVNPRGYVKVRRHRKAVWLRHFDAVSCLSVDEENGFLYSSSWDKTFKVWRLSDSRCLESVAAHDDAINSIAVGFNGLVFTGSADGKVKSWRRDARSKHVLARTMLEQDCAVTALVVERASAVLYSASSDGAVNVWRGSAHVAVLRGHRQAVLCLAAAGGLVLSGSADKTICVWQRDGSGEHVRVAVLSGHEGPVKCLAVEENSAPETGEGEKQWTVFSGSLDRSVKVWSVSNVWGLDRRNAGADGDLLENGLVGGQTPTTNSDRHDLARTHAGF